MNIIFLVPAFFITALLYSMVGLGGGSAYISLMVLSGVPKDVFPPIALLCNLLVASQGAFRFRQAGHFRWGLFWPFAVTSIPLAYIGGRIRLPDKVFMILLVIALILAGVRLLFWRRPESAATTHKGHIMIKLLTGLVLGFFAGITGIGGGIYLIPTLILLRLATPQEAAAVASLFVVVNSASGLLGHLSKGHMEWPLFLPLAIAVLIGGFMGSKAGSTRLKGETLQKITGVIILVAAIKLIGGLL